MTRDEEVQNFARVPLPTLDKLLEIQIASGNAHAAGIIRDAQQRHGATQTAELSHCGRLFPHNEVIVDHNALPIPAVTRYTGDISAFMAPFMGGAIVGTVDRDAGTHTETGRLRDGDRVQIIRAGAAG